MPNNLNLSSEIIDKIIENIVNVVPTRSIYIFNKYADSIKTDNSELNIYVVTTKNNSDKRDFEGAGDVGVSLFWLNKPLNIFCLAEKEFERRTKRPIGLEQKVVKEGIKIYEQSV